MWRSCGVTYLLDIPLRAFSVLFCWIGIKYWLLFAIRVCRHHWRCPVVQFLHVNIIQGGRQGRKAWYCIPSQKIRLLLMNGDRRFGGWPTKPVSKTSAGAAFTSPNKTIREICNGSFWIQGRALCWTLAVHWLLLQCLRWISNLPGELFSFFSDLFSFVIIYGS